MSVSSTDVDGSEYAGDHLREESQIGAVYVPIHGVILEDDPAIRYERHQRIERFELDGIKPAPVCCIIPFAAEQPEGDPPV